MKAGGVGTVGWELGVTVAFFVMRRVVGHGRGVVRGCVRSVVRARTRMVGGGGGVVAWGRGRILDGGQGL